MPTIKEGEKAPDFSLPDAKGKEVHLSKFSGSWVVLYFYPKDDTPGCTTEACGFRDAYKELEKLGAKVVGISPDDAQSHQKFAEKYRLPFALLSDAGGKVASKYGVWSGKMERTTFIISPQGVVKKIFRNVKPEGHEKEVVAWLKEHF
ncbi:MAG: thioredoxin-dependent thiol peroxidase [Candidatus Anstonellaceae archaeon]